MVSEEFIINLDFLNLKVIIQNNKILEIDIVKEKNLNSNTLKNHKKLIDEIKYYFYGDKDKFDLNIVNLTNLTDFQREVLFTLTKVPRGKVTTYKNLSLKLKREKSYRAVGNVLRINPFPIIIPCHRVIKSDFSVGEYGYGKDLKKKLLIFEGVLFSDDNRVKSECVL